VSLEFDASVAWTSAVNGDDNIAHRRQRVQPQKPPSHQTIQLLPQTCKVISQKATSMPHMDDILILHNGPPLPPPSKFPLCTGDLGPHLTCGSLCPPESTTQMASQSVKPFLQGSRSWQTDRPCYSVTIGHIYVCNTAMQPNNVSLCRHKTRPG